MTDAYLRYLELTQQRLRDLAETQQQAVLAAGRACADSIGSDKLAFTFGTGHGSFAALEMFPRTGTPVGFRPIVETPIALFHHVLGDMGSYQYRFLHTREGYGNAILRAHRLDPGDTMLLFSHSGINPVILDMAVAAKEMGMTVVGITSVPHSSQVESRHSSGQRLFEIADVVVDNCTDLTDAAVAIPQHRDPIAPVSTIAFVTLVWMIIATVAEILVAQGIKLYIHPSHNLPGDTTAHQRLDEALREYKRRVAGV